MLAIGSVVWGVNDVPRAVAFWCAALDYRPLRAPQDDWAILVPRTGAGPQLAIARVTSAAQDHQRHHLDLYADDAAAEVDRLLALGARRVDWRYPPGADYIVLADPDGNSVCVVEKAGVAHDDARDAATDDANAARTGAGTDGAAPGPDGSPR